MPAVSIAPEIHAQNRVNPIPICPTLSTFERIHNNGSGPNNSKFNIIAPNPTVFMSRVIRMREQFTLTLTATDPASVAANPFDTDTYSALRTCFDLRIKNNQTITINGQSLPQTQVALCYTDIVPHYNGKIREISPLSTPDGYSGNTAPEITGSISAGFQGYAESLSGFGAKRGAYQCIKSYTYVAGAAGTRASVLTIVFEVVSWVYVPGLLGIDCMDQDGLTRIKQIGINNVYQGLSIGEAIITGAPLTGYGASLVHGLGNNTYDDEVTVQYFSVPAEMVPSGPLVYPFRRFEPFATGIASGLASQTTANVQLNIVPRRVFIFVKSPPTTTDVLDSFKPIKSVTITFANQSGLLATAEQWDLYRMSKECGLIDSWPEFCGEALDSWKPASATSVQITPTGSAPICLEFGRHISLPGGLVPGAAGSFNFVVKVDLFDVVGAGYAVHTIFDTNHEMVVDDGGAVFLRYPPLSGVDDTQGGAAEGEEDEDVMEIPWSSHFQEGHVYGGSSIGGNKFVDFFKSIGRWFKNNKVISKLANAVGPALSALPGPIGMIGPTIASTIGRTAQNLGYGGSAMGASALRAQIARM